MGNYSILKMSFFHKYKYFSSFEAGNRVRNSSFERMNDKNHNSAVGLPDQKLSSMFMFPEGYVIIKVKKWLFCIAVPRGGEGYPCRHTPENPPDCLMFIAFSLRIGLSRKSVPIPENKKALLKRRANAASQRGCVQFIVFASGNWPVSQYLGNEMIIFLLAILHGLHPVG